ncbi:MAG: HAD-IIB family hydrolase [Deltaproteobacteria bacterium]|nr:HAD-IIB family hydrolase [Deltaproteobacteria bacterium]
MNNPRQLVVFTDLDGTLLDHDTYSFDAARPALAELHRRRIPLIVCTSKTAAEILELRAAIGNRDPFISENGGGVFIPYRFFSFSVNAGRTAAGCHVLELGTCYSTLHEALGAIMRATGLALRGFSMMEAEEVAALCNFSSWQAALAKQRDYDEPFVLARPEDATPAAAALLAAAAARLGLRVTRGGRFFHLTGDNDKGRAVRMLKELFVRQYGTVYTLALGDSANDGPMLREADVAVLMQKKDGSYDAAIKNPVVRFGAPGPAGWNEAVMQMLDAR